MQRTLSYIYLSRGALFLVGTPVCTLWKKEKLFVVPDIVTHFSVVQPVAWPLCQYADYVTVLSGLPSFQQDFYF
jgi:hypothetical protein